MPHSLTVSAPAKLNLAIHILGRREDGYHRLESLVVFTELADTLIFSPADALTLDVNGEFAEAAGAPSDNLVLRAARALQNAANYPGGAHIVLTKNIPVGAGLGGGSADAAATLRVLNDLWQLKLEEAQLFAIAASLGADVPMCLLGVPLVARGVGEQLAPLHRALPNMAVVLAYPNVHVASAEVYRALDAPMEVAGATSLEIPSFASFSPFAEWLNRETRNDLQPAAMEVAPVLAEMLAAMEATHRPKPALVRMTGSGSCCFALFAEASQTESYALELAARHPDWRVCATPIR